jgi:hypothetical protein
MEVARAEKNPRAECLTTLRALPIIPPVAPEDLQGSLEAGGLAASKRFK